MARVAETHSRPNEIITWSSPKTGDSCFEQDAVSNNAANAKNERIFFILNYV